MSIRWRFGNALAAVMGANTDKLWKLHQRRRFDDFKRKWSQASLLDFPYERRDVLYRHVHDLHIGDAAIDYLEFGCWRGESMRAWSAMNRHPASRFFGFDSFEGLPEDWAEDTPRGTFSESGRVPAIDDPRVTFVKGWFQDTLPGFWRAYTPQCRQVIHLDADLYSSTLFALITLNPPAGSLLLFDEFSDALHEFRAFEDFLCACNRDYRVLAARRDFHKLAMELL